jgi:hypothetical protein
MGEWDPQRAMNEQITLLKFRREDGWGPQPPKPKAGDVSVIVGAVVGMVVGGVAAGFLLSIVMALVGVVVGGVLGALLGSLVKSQLEKRKGTHAKDS